MKWYTSIKKRLWASRTNVRFFGVLSLKEKLMKKIAFSPIALLSLTVALAAFLIGCGQSVEPDADTSVANTSATENDDPSQGGWWCVEHGIPEEECSMCSTKAADAAKAKLVPLDVVPAALFWNGAPADCAHRQDPEAGDLSDQ